MKKKYFSVFICICSLMTVAFSQHVHELVKTEIKDDHGNQLNAHGAGILNYAGTYYLFGEIKKGNTYLVPGQQWEDYRVPAGGVSCYSSKDFVHWKYEGIALAPVVSDPENDMDTSRVLERPKVIYNEGTRKFVMWLHIDKSDYNYARAGVAVSDQPQGPYKYLGSLRPNGQESRDMTVFKDSNGHAYLIYASEGNNTMHISALSEDYLSLTGEYNRILINQRREAPALFRYNGKYFLITSLCSGWTPNAALYSVADSVMGHWESRGNPCSGPGADSTFGAQSTFVLPLRDSHGSFLFMADRWNKTNLSNSRYLWIPFSMEGDKLEIKNRKK